LGKSSHTSAAPPLAETQREVGVQAPGARSASAAANGTTWTSGQGAQHRHNYRSKFLIITLILIPEAGSDVCQSHHVQAVSVLIVGILYQSDEQVAVFLKKTTAIYEMSVTRMLILK
jgi:hypothetical protein